MSREFCPPYCNNIDGPTKVCSAPTYLSSARDRDKDRCYHLDDKVLDPRPVEVKKTRELWVDGEIVGENGDMWYVMVDNWNIPPSLAGIKKGSPLIRKK